MGDFTEQLKSNKIITAQDIVRLRTYIENKHPNFDVHQRANVLINSIRKIIDGYLKSVPADKKNEIRENLLKNTLLSKQETILLYDLFETITTTYAKENSTPDLVLDWVNSHLDKPINKEELFQHFNPVAENNIVSSEIESNTFTSNTPNMCEPNYNVIKEDILSEQFNFKKAKLSFEPNPIKVMFAGLALITFLSVFINYLTTNSVKAKEENIVVENENIEVIHPHLPDYFRYKDVDENKLKTYLKSRDSLLEEEPYFSSIINTAREFELNPLILFAIAGHEQGFVPKTNPLSSEIVNNPFNVFISWQQYNTDIVDSSQIAARTVINLSKDRPDEIDPFQWINRKYAEDTNWWKGVRSIFYRLEREVVNFSSNKI